MGKVMQIFKVGFLNRSMTFLVVCDTVDEAKEKAGKFKSKRAGFDWGKPYIHSVLGKLDDCVFQDTPQKNA